MSWKKLGLIYDPKVHEKTAGGGYGANPVAVPIKDTIYRIFFNIRDERNRAHVTFLDYDIEDLCILDFSGKRLISPGEMGAFDDSGCSLGCILDRGEQFYIYYLGWNLLKTAPFMNTIGLAIYDKKTDSCSKYSRGPILGRSMEDPFSISYPFVCFKDGEYKMWYGSHVTWGDTTFEHYDFTHVITYANAQDGIHFERNGTVCIAGDEKHEYAFARPSVLVEDDLYKMWYTYRGDHYRIGYAESEDGISWTRRDDEAGICASGDSWESEEISYPYVFSHNGKHYMLYCGNGYGKTGFGIAVEE